jgi:hypothetical protein
LRTRLDGTKPDPAARGRPRSGSYRRGLNHAEHRPVFVSALVVTGLIQADALSTWATSMRRSTSSIPISTLTGSSRRRPAPLYHVSFRGEFVRIILDMMRDAQGPVTTKEITLHVMRGRGLNTADAALVALF